MKNKKFLLFLFSLVIYINYNNYIAEDTNKLYRDINYLESKILQEKEFSQNYELKDTNNHVRENLFYKKEQNYSVAISEMQTFINKKVVDLCEISNIKWGQTIPNDELWYDSLKLSISLNCNPTNFNIFLNEIYKNEKIYKIENLYAIKNRKEDYLDINFQLTGYKIK